MSDYISQLQKLGLTDTESSIYIAGLSSPRSTASSLSKVTGIKRPTVYHALETLAVKGLVAKTGTQGRNTFHMTDPERLHRLLDQQIEQLHLEKRSLETLIPLLSQKRALVSDTQVIQYEGIDGIKMVVEEALYCKSRRWDIIAPPKNFFSEFDKDYASYFVSSRTSRGIRARTLWERKDHFPKKLTQKVLDERNPRYMPPALYGKFTSVLILFDSNVAIINSLGSKSAILINSKEVHDLISVLFEGVWLSSEPVTLS